MELVANQEQGVSAFFRDERETGKGIHVGFVCDSLTPASARIATYVWARIKRDISPELLSEVIFNIGA